MPTPVPLTLLTKPGCHLCDDARAAISRVRAELDERGVSTTLEERSILEDAELARLHAEDIPVVFIGAKRHAIWRVDPDRLTQAIERASGQRGRFFRGS